MGCRVFFEFLNQYACPPYFHTGENEMFKLRLCDPDVALRKISLPYSAYISNDPSFRNKNTAMTNLSILFCSRCILFRFSDNFVRVLTRCYRHITFNSSASPKKIDLGHGMQIAPAGLQIHSNKLR